MENGTCDRCGDETSALKTICRSCSALLDKIVWRWMGGTRDHTNEEFAQELGITLSNLEKRIQKAKALYRKQSIL